MSFQALFVASPLGALPAPAAQLRALVEFDRLFWWSVAGVGMALAWFLLRWWLNRRPEPAPLPPRLPAPTPRSKFRVRVETLRDEVEINGEYRRGCHALARQVREELQSTLGAGSLSLAMTATEIARRSPDPRLDALVRRLREVRFAQVHPRRSEFRKLCNDAVHTFDQESV